MQPRVNDTRSLTSAQIVTLLQDSPAPQLRGGLEVVNLDLNVIEDVSDDFVGGEVGRNSFADLHGTATIRIQRPLDWGGGLVRPYITVTGGTQVSEALSARFNLGVYHLTVPEFSTREVPQTYEVGGFDILLRLADPVGDAYAIAAGDAYLTKVEDILVSRGFTQYVIDQTAAATVAPTDRAWIFDENLTWLKVVNDLLASIGYQGIWSDWDGRLRCEPYVLPQSRQVEWTYDDDKATTMLGLERKFVRDFTDAPNRWVIYRSNNVDDLPPVEGAGMVTIQNDTIGDTSVVSRGGRVITKIVGVDAADQGSLIAQANAIVQTDMDIPLVITGTLLGVNPLHWHFDRLFLDTAEFLGDVQCTEWSMPLPPDTGDMAFTLRVVSQ